MRLGREMSEIHGSEDAMTVGRLCKLRNLSNSSRRSDEVSVEFALFISKGLLKRRMK